MIERFQYYLNAHWLESRQRRSQIFDEKSRASFELRQETGDKRRHGILYF